MILQSSVVTMFQLIRAVVRRFCFSRRTNRREVKDFDTLLSMRAPIDPEQFVFTLKRVQTGSPTFCARVEEFPDLEGFGSTADRACFDLIAAIRAAIDAGATPVQPGGDQDLVVSPTPAVPTTSGNDQNLLSLILPDKLFSRLARLSAKRKISMDDCIEQLLTNAVRREMKSGRPPSSE